MCPEVLEGAEEETSLVNTGCFSEHGIQTAELSITRLTFNNSATVQLKLTMTGMCTDLIWYKATEITGNSWSVAVILFSPHRYFTPLLGPPFWHCLDFFREFNQTAKIKYNYKFYIVSVALVGLSKNYTIVLYWISTLSCTSLLTYNSKGVVFFNLLMGYMS